MLNLKKMFLLLCFSFLSVFVLNGHASAASLSFLPSNNTINVGQTVQMDIWVSDLVDIDLVSFQLSVDYDNPILELTSYDFGPYLTNASMMAYDGTLSFFSEINSNDATLLLASLTFTGGAAGECWLTFGSGVFFPRDSDGQAIFIEDLGSAVITVADAEPVPEPATMILLGTGLMGMAFSRKKRSA